MACGLARPVSAGAKISIHLGAKQKICERRENQAVHSDLASGMKEADDYVECHPGQRQPSCPVAGAEHECSRDNRNETDEEYPDCVVSKRMLGVEVGEMEGDSKRTCCNKQPADDGDGKWAVVHKVLK